MRTYLARTQTQRTQVCYSKLLHQNPSKPTLLIGTHLSLCIFFHLPRVLPFFVVPLLCLHWSGIHHRQRGGLMTPPLEHDYIGLSEVPAMEAYDKLSVPASALAAEDDRLANLKETELRLGLPGSESPDRKDKDQALLTLGLPKGFVSGAKRGFSDAIDGSGKWVFSGGAGSEVESRKGGGLFSPRGDGNGGQLAGAVSAAGKDAGLVSKAASPEKKGQVSPSRTDRGGGHAAKAQVVGWPPIRSYRKNTMAANPPKNSDDPEGKQGSGCLYVKVSMDGAPYLRKVDLKTYGNYEELSSALEKMFSCFTIGQCGTHGVPGRDGLSESHLIDLLHGSEYVLTYEDKDGDWMLVGDVPWDMFTDTCKRLRIMKGSEAIGLGQASGSHRSDNWESGMLKDGCEELLLRSV